MFKGNRLVAAAAVVGALAAAGPVSSASAASSTAAGPSGGTAGSSIPCYPLPAFCNPTTGQPASWAPWWVWPALGLQAPGPILPPITFQQPIAIPSPIAIGHRA